MSDRTSAETAEGIRRVKLVVVGVFLLTLLGLLPALFVQDKFGYVAAWLFFLLVSQTALVLGLARVQGRITRRAVRATTYIVGVLAAAALGAVLHFVR